MCTEPQEQPRFLERSAVTAMPCTWNKLCAYGFGKAERVLSVTDILKKKASSVYVRMVQFQWNFESWCLPLGVAPCNLCNFEAASPEVLFCDNAGRTREQKALLLFFVSLFVRFSSKSEWCHSGFSDKVVIIARGQKLLWKCSSGSSVRGHRSVRSVESSAELCLLAAALLLSTLSCW